MMPWRIAEETLIRKVIPRHEEVHLPEVSFAYGNLSGYEIGVAHV